MITPSKARQKLRSVVLGILISTPTMARAQTDTLPHVPLFTWQDAVLAGGFLAGTVALRPVDEYFANHLQTKYAQQNRFFQEVSTVVRTIAEPGAFIIGGSLYAIGRASKQHDMADLGLHGTESVIIASVFAGVLKDSFGRARPYVHPPNDTTGYNSSDWQFGRGLTRGDAYRSFPSGHAVAAFAAAAAVANETARWWPSWRWVIGPTMYAGAGLVGVSRMYNNRHWASDVMMGAAIGTFAGDKVVRYFHRTNPNNKLDQWLLGASLHPAPGGGFTHSLFFAPAPRVPASRR